MWYISKNDYIKTFAMLNLLIVIRKIVCWKIDMGIINSFHDTKLQPVTYIFLYALKYRNKVRVNL